jgi:hypothetical protein
VKSSLRGLLGGHPRLALTVLKGASKLRSVTISLPHDLLVKNTKTGLGATGSKFKLGKKSLKLSRKGKLTLKLPSSGANSVTAKLSKGSFVASKKLRAKLRKHKSVKLGFTVRTVDSGGHRTTLHVKVTGRR